MTVCSCVQAGCRRLCAQVFRQDADDCVLMCSGRMQMTVLMCSGRMQMTVCSCVQAGCR